MVRKKDIDETILALKYPDYHTWRDLDAALKNGGVWPNGSTVRLSDPEMRPKIDEIMEMIENDEAYRNDFLQKIGIHPDN